MPDACLLVLRRSSCRRAAMSITQQLLHPRFPFALVCAMTALAAPLAAQDTDEDAQQEDASLIVVTGEGLPDTPATPAYDAQTITRDELIATPSGRIEDALASVAGFQQFRRSDSRSSNPSAQGVTLRALGGNATSRALSWP